MFLKQGELIELGMNSVQSADAVMPILDPEIVENFKKTATGLKKIAPKANDFLYFSAVMMHAAESAIINEDGTIKLARDGSPLKAGWQKKGDSWKWTCTDLNVKAYRNSNGDIFPEEELVKAYKKWIGKPLCIDHKSNSVDHVRGFIVDTYYDRALKRVIALCALDKFNYPDLARKVSTGYSNSVSMGTAVGKAVCYDCGNVARVEQDFCNHMRSKSCYGEINIDLSPIELSIVVNGADPQAKIKHIIAAANTLNSYVDMRNEELKKLAEVKYTAQIGVSNSDGHHFQGSKIDISGNDLEKFEEDLRDAFEKLREISEDVKNLPEHSGSDSENSEESSEDSNNLASNQSSGTVAMEETALPNTDSSLPSYSQRFASSNELQKLNSSIEGKLHDMKRVLDKLVNQSTNIKEENMFVSKDGFNKGAYYQGGGEANEPTPGKPKYEKDPMNEDLRSGGDKHMVGQKPFPEVGDVDGLHPSPSSVSESNELERKKMLARAESEERAIRRAAAVKAAKSALESKKAYYQGTEEPTPGKRQYQADSLNEEMREKGDKQMVGAKPFPETGKVDELYPGDMETKKLHQRASLLRAKFVKSANLNGTVNLGASGWQVYHGDKLLLTASVNDITGGRTDALYDTIATKEFGAKLLEKVKVFGADRVSTMYKSAQMPAAPAAAPADAAAAMPAMPAAATAEPAAPAPAAPAMDMGGEGDPKDKVVSLAQQAVDVTSDLLEAVRALTGERAEMGELDALTAPVEASSAKVSSASLNKMRKELNYALKESMLESVAELKDHVAELKMISSMYDNGTLTGNNSHELAAVVEEAVSDVKSAIANSRKLMGAFVKYARGTEALVKRATIEAKMFKSAQSDEKLNKELAEILGESPTDSLSNNDAMDILNLAEEASGDDSMSDNDESYADALSADMTISAPDGKKYKLAPASVDTKSGRAQLRAKLAAEMGFSSMLDEAHPEGGFSTKLDVKPSGNLGHVEDLEEVHDAMMDLAKASPKAAKEASAIHALVSEGKLDAKDINSLAAHGVDQETIAYYKKFYGQVDGGSEFATELVKEHAKAAAEADKNLYKVKIARAYELANDMVKAGLVAGNRQAVSAQVDEIMKFNDESFESMNRVVARHAPTLTKSASKLPMVGMLDSTPTQEVEREDLRSQLASVFSSNTRRMF
jgi:hypothetical protein